MIEPVEQSLTNILQICELKIYITARNLGQAQELARGAGTLLPHE